MKKLFIIAILIIATISVVSAELYFPVVDTGQTICYDNLNEITAPAQGTAFYGQDAQFNGNQPSYTDNGDGTITDNITGLMWTKSCDTDGDGDIDYDDKLSYFEAIASIGDVDIAGYNDWRVPTIKEQYSLIQFNGIDPSGFEGATDDLVPFIDTDYFDFAYGNEDSGERIIDAQMVTSTLYVGTTMDGAETMFGVNFADGRIKGYGTGPMPGQSQDKQFYIYYVRGNTQYGINDLQYNNDGTITDFATGLNWAQSDNQEAISWEAALTWVEQKNSENYLGHNDWRLPDIKELQSIVDYTRAPSVTDSPAIDPLFNCSEILDQQGDSNYPYYWSGTTHSNWTENAGSAAAYVCFGDAQGWMESMPPGSGNYSLMDVHGAGSQRSDFKTGDPADFPHGNGPQGDVIRIYNYVRLVRTANTSANEDQSSELNIPSLKQNYPNPFNPTTTIEYQIGAELDILELAIFNARGQKVQQNKLSTETTSYTWNADNYSSGIYFYQLISGIDVLDTKKMILMK